MDKDHPQRDRSGSASLVDYVFRDDRPHFLQSCLLCVRNEFMGFLLVEAERTDIRIMRILGNHLSIALNSIILFERLDQSYRRLMEQAHKKGMADTTGILHNIANIISSVNITRQALEDLMEDSCLDDLVMANDILANRFDELESFIRDDDRGILLMKYYAALGDSFTRFRENLRGHVGRLLERVALSKPSSTRSRACRHKVSLGALM